MPYVESYPYLVPGIVLCSRVLRILHSLLHSWDRSVAWSQGQSEKKKCFCRTRRLKMAAFLVLDVAVAVYAVDLILAVTRDEPGIRVAPCEFVEICA